MRVVADLPVLGEPVARELNPVAGLVLRDRDGAAEPFDGDRPPLALESGRVGRRAGRRSMASGQLATWSVRSTSGGPSVSSTAATLVPIASIAKIARPPSTSVKYLRSRGTSLDGV